MEHVAHGAVVAGKEADAGCAGRRKSVGPAAEHAYMGAVALLGEEPPVAGRIAGDNPLQVDKDYRRAEQEEGGVVGPGEGDIVADVVVAAGAAIASHTRSLHKGHYVPVAA